MAELHLGERCGIGRLCHEIKLRGDAALAKQVSAQHRRRKVVAHPSQGKHLPAQVHTVLSAPVDPLVRLDPWANSRQVAATHNDRDRCDRLSEPTSDPWAKWERSLGEECEPNPNGKLPNFTNAFASGDDPNLRGVGLVTEVDVKVVVFKAQVSEEEARRALEEAHGNPIDAVIALRHRSPDGSGHDRSETLRESELLDGTIDLAERPSCFQLAPISKRGMAGCSQKGPRPHAHGKRSPTGGSTHSRRNPLDKGTDGRHKRR